MLLHGLRVLELAGGVATRYCGRLLGRLGADVTAVGHRDDVAIGYGGEAGRDFGRWLDEGKRHVEAVSERAGGVDLVVAGQDERAVAEGEALMDRLPAGPPVLLALRWFDPAGPYGRWRGTDEVIHALCGVAYSFGEREGPPTLPQGHAPQVVAGLNACNAALGALLERPGHRPHRVDVNVLESFMCVPEVAAVSWLADDSAVSVRLGVNRLVPTYPCSSYATADGWVGVTCLTPAQWSALCAAVDRPELAAERRYATAFKRLMRADEVDDVLAPAFATRTSAEWVAVGRERRIPITEMLPPAELPGHEHWRERASFAPVPGTGAIGPTSPFRVRLDGTTRSRQAPAGGTGPLAGVRVLDFSMGWAGPLATRYLGDLGADVVKVESTAHPDWYRGWEADQGGDPPRYELRAHFNTLNRNKRGIALDLTTPDGLGAAKELLASADVVVENFATGVLDRLGLGVDVQRAVNPGVIAVSMPAFGGTGPLAGMRAYGSTVEQASGLPFVNGHAAWPPSLQHVALGDPIAGLYAVAAILAALWGRPSEGGATIDLSQVECLFQVGADAFTALHALGGAVPRTGDRRARMVPCVVVPCRGEDAWLAVGVDGEVAWVGLCRALGERGWEADPALSTPSGRRRREEQVEQAIAGWAADLDAAEAAAELQALGVPAAPVQPAHALGQDPQLAATGYWETMERRYVGRHSLGAPPFRFDGSRPRARRPAPTLGEHTGEVLGA